MKENVKVVLVATTEDGAVFEGETFEDLVTAMKLDMWIVPRTREEYMEGVARRSEIFSGERINYHDEQTFILELVRIGVITSLVIERREVDG